MPTPETRPYRPPNGTSGSMFRARMCDRCTRDTNADCRIFIRAMIHEVGDPEYPAEWVQDPGDPIGATARCTKFEALP